MKTLTLLGLLLCLLAMLETCSSQIFKNDMIIPINPMNRKLTRRELKKLEPKIDGIPVGKIMPHPSSGEVINKRPTIIGGQIVTTNKFPWMVGMLINNAWFCGGSVISPSWVLTAAHCVTGLRNAQLFMGTLDWTNNATRISFTSNISFFHSAYLRSTVSNDIGLIQLPTAIDNKLITEGRIVPIRLPSASQANQTFVDTLVTISGWGFTKNGGPVSNALNVVAMPIIPNSDCARIYGTSIILSSTMCTSPGTIKIPTNICSGDSGSALHFKENDTRTTQLGIVSFNAAATCFGNPSGYTRVTSYLAWISEKTGLFIRS